MKLVIRLADLIDFYREKKGRELGVEFTKQMGYTEDDNNRGVYEMPVNIFANGSLRIMFGTELEKFPHPLPLDDIDKEYKMMRTSIIGKDDK